MVLVMYGMVMIAMFIAVSAAALKDAQLAKAGNKPG
jgi:hypothetical protein